MSAELAKRLEEYAAKLAADKSSETAWWKHPLANDIREAAALLRAREPEARPTQVTHATVRDAEDEWHIECRFADGQKYAAVRVDKECEWLADAIAAWLSAPVAEGWVPVSERLPDFTQAVAVLVYGDDGDGTHYWQASVLGFTDKTWIERYRITHWMPLPAAPQPKETER